MPNVQITPETSTPRLSLDDRLRTISDADLAMMRGRARLDAAFDNGFDNGFDNSVKPT